jgi:hypothetical protein
MNEKHEAIINFSLLINRGFSNPESCEYFENKKHDELISELITYIDKHKDLIGVVNIENTQALNDKGVDIIIILPNQVKIGIQIKSFFDVEEPKFNSNVKRQFADSLSYGLDKWYLLICSPLKVGKKDYSHKIHTLLNELNAYKSNYHVVISPENSLKLFDITTPAITQEMFDQRKRFYSSVENKNELNQLQKDVRASISILPKKSEIEIATDIALKGKNGKINSHANSFCEYLGCKTEKENEVVQKWLEKYFQTLKSLPIPTRKFYYFLVKQAEYGNGGFHENLSISYEEVEASISTSKQEINSQLKILEQSKFKLIRVDEDDGAIDIARLNSDDHYPNFIKEYCEEKGVDLEKIINDLDFSLLD